jgi:osmotically-inducible protein OsmY
MSNDKRLQQAVLAELNWEPSVTAAHIGVAAKDGVVTLSGHVESFVERHAAESAARRVKGVKAVAEEIEVHLPFDARRDDDEIAAAAVDRLAWDVSVPRDSIQVNVEKGWITLVGEVDRYYRKAAAEKDVEGLFGVVGVTNQITIKPTANAENISNDIMHALHRSGFFAPKTITVTAQEGNVRLAGNVDSWRDWEIATATAWSAPGTTAVENNILIT